MEAMVKLRNAQPAASLQPFLKKRDDGKTRALSCIAASRENNNAGGQLSSNVGAGYGSHASVYDGKSNAASIALLKQSNPSSSANSAIVPRLTCPYPDANTNSQMARVLHEISNSTKQDGQAFPATQVAAAFHRWRYSHLKVEQRLQMELLKAIERAERAEATVEKRNIEISRLREELRKVEEENSKTITKLQADISLLQNESDCEFHNVMDQLTGKSQEPPSYLLKRSFLGSQFGKQKKKFAKRTKEKVNSLDEKDTSKFNFRLEVSLYNELQKLQDLIVREARLHQEKVGHQEEGTNQEEIGSNASPFSTSLWRICNGLAHCLIEARNQILALAGNSELKTCQKLAPMSKGCKKYKNLGSHQTLSKKGSKKTLQKTRFRFLKTDPKCKEEKSSHKNLGYESKQAAEGAEILEFVGGGKVAKVSELGT